LYEDEKVKKNIKVDETMRKEIEFLSRQIENKVA
jgi:hypothetical protein